MEWFSGLGLQGFLKLPEKTTTKKNPKWQQKYDKNSDGLKVLPQFETSKKLFMFSILGVSHLVLEALSS